ncbi:unnamed protein product [Ectocarpus sp. 12 AP-2014]
MILPSSPNVRNSAVTISGGNLRRNYIYLVLLAEVLLLALALGGLRADLFVVLLEGSQVLTGLGELSLLHALTHVPVHERTLGVHEVELVVDARQGLRFRCMVWWWCIHCEVMAQRSKGKSRQAESGWETPRKK